MVRFRRKGFMPAAVRSTDRDRGHGVSSLKTYDPAEVAELVKVTRRTVYNWIASGVLPATKAGPKLWRVTEADLRSFLTGRGSEAVELLPPEPKPKRKWQRRPPKPEPTEWEIEERNRRAMRRAQLAAERAEYQATVSKFRDLASQGDPYARAFLLRIDEPLPAVVQSKGSAQNLGLSKPLVPMTPPPGGRNRAKKKSRR